MSAINTTFSPSPLGVINTNKIIDDNFDNIDNFDNSFSFSAASAAVVVSVD
jgi:hypothetical protein